MTKSVSLGLLALILSVFSSQVLASNIDACDEVKRAKNGLHGLCVAWHNADEKNKDKIAAKYKYRSGGKDVPGSTTAFSCPCWAGVELAGIGAVTPPELCVFNFPPDGDDLALFGDNYSQQDFVTNGVDCGYFASYTDNGGNPVIRDNIAFDLGAEGEVCAMEMAQIVDQYFQNGSDCLVFP